MTPNQFSDDNRLVSLGKWASIIMIFITTTFTSIKLGLELISIHKKRRLDGSNVLITNGDSSLSQKLGEKLQETLACKIIYLPKSDMKNLNDFEKEMNEIYKEHGRVDVVVHNGHQFLASAQDEACFALHEGESLIEILNIFKYCIPKMNRTNGGHFVSIKSHQSSFRALINTRNDLRNYALDLINDTNNQASPPQISKPEFSLSVIQCDCSWSTQVSEKEIAQKLHDAIVSQKAVVRIGSGVWHSVRSWLNYFNQFTGSVLHLL